MKNSEYEANTQYNDRAVHLYCLNERARNTLELQNEQDLVNVKAGLD